MLLKCHLQGEHSGTTLAMEHKGCLQEFALRFLDVQCPGALRMALSPCPLSSTPGELPGKRGWIWPWNVLQSRGAVLNIPHTNSGVDLSFNHTPKGWCRNRVVDTHCPQVQGEDERRSTGEVSMHVQI